MTVDRRAFIAGATLLTVAPGTSVVASSTVCAGSKRPPHCVDDRRME